MSVYVVYHKPGKYLKTDFYKPICVGDNKKDFSEDFIRDDEGKNIAFLNDSYNELTALYRIWQDDQRTDEYVGLAHYRRYLGVGMDKSHYLYRSFRAAKPKIEKAEKNFYSLAEKPDIIVPNPARHRSVRDYYALAHGKEDVDILLDVIDRCFPTYSDCARRYFSGENDYLCNLFIMKREVFTRYAEWLFGVLDEFVKERAKEERLFISERATGIFIRKMIEEGKTVRRAPMITVDPRPRLTEVIKSVTLSEERGRQRWKPLIHSMIPTTLWRRYYRGVYKAR